MATHTTTNETVTAALNLIAVEIMNRPCNLDLVLVDSSDESLCDAIIEWPNGNIEPVFSIASQLIEGTW